MLFCSSNFCSIIAGNSRKYQISQRPPLAPLATVPRGWRMDVEWVLHGWCYYNTQSLPPGPEYVNRGVFAPETPVHGWRLEVLCASRHHGWDAGQVSLPRHRFQHHHPHPICFSSMSFHLVGDYGWGMVWIMKLLMRCLIARLFEDAFPAREGYSLHNHL